MNNMNIKKEVTDFVSHDFILNRNDNNNFIY